MPHRGTTVSVEELTREELAAKELAAFPDYCNGLVVSMLSTAYCHRTGLVDKSIPRFAEYHYTVNGDLDRIVDWSIEVRSETCTVYELHLPKFIQEAGLVKSFLDIIASHLELYYSDCKVILGNVLPPCQLAIRVEKKM